MTHSSLEGAESLCCQRTFMSYDSLWRRGVNEEGEGAGGGGGGGGSGGGRGRF